MPPFFLFIIGSGDGIYPAPTSEKTEEYRAE
jgi:hypothetical protein